MISSMAGWIKWDLLMPGRGSVLPTRLIVLLGIPLNSILVVTLGVGDHLLWLNLGNRVLCWYSILVNFLIWWRIQAFGMILISLTASQCRMVDRVYDPGTLAKTKYLVVVCDTKLSAPAVKQPESGVPLVEMVVS